MAGPPPYEGIHLVPEVEVPDLRTVAGESSPHHRQDQTLTTLANPTVRTREAFTTQPHVIEGPGVLLHPVEGHTEIDGLTILRACLKSFQ